MKKYLFTFFLALGSILAAYSQSIPNGGFENWIVSSFDNPQYYGTSNYQSNGSNTPGPINVIRTTDSYTNSFAIRLTTSLTATGDTAFAYVANGDPTNPAGQGIPYNEQPSGLQFRYKCNVMSGDSAIVWVIFKKTGSIIGSYMKKITGSQASYTLGAMGFSLTQAPDSIIFAAVSSNPFTSNGFPGSMLQLDSVRFTGVTSQPTNFNGDFELWQTISGKKPTGWNVSSGESPSNTQTTDFYSGTYALELVTQNHSWGTSPEGATTGVPTQSSTIGGWPFSNQNDTLIFYYKYTPGNILDSASYGLGFKKNGVYVGWIGGLLPAAASYTQKKIVINLGTAPDTLIINLTSSKTWSTPASYAGAVFKVDNMFMASQQTPVTDLIAPSAGCVSQTVQINDNSSNLPTSWTWTLTGSSTPTSSAQNPIATYTAPGTYTIMHSASNTNGSGATISKTITINAVPSLTVAAPPSICAGNSATLTASGATSYMWNIGFTNPTIVVNPTVNTTYSVVGTTSGCSNMAALTVTVNPLPNVMATAPASACATTSACLSGTGAVNYSWTGPCGFSSTLQSPCLPMIPGCGCTFSLTGTDSFGCSKTVSVCINILPSPTVTAMTSNSIICGPPFQGTATLTGNGAVSYNWNPGGSGTSISVSPSVTTTYTITGTDGNGCQNTSMITQTVSTCSGINTITGEESSISIYPNPNNGDFMIRGTTDDKIIIINELGQEIKTVELNSTNNYQVEVNDLTSGIYFASGKYERFRIVVLK